MASAVMTSVRDMRAIRAVRPDLIPAVYVVAFTVGTVTHVADVLRWGILPRNQYHLTFNIFWTSLTLFDPLAIVLLLRHQRSGVLLGGLIMVLDVAVNSAAGLHEYFATGRFLMWGLFTQMPFAVFLLATAPYWVLDLLQSTVSWGPVFYACHDPAVLAYQSATIEGFLDDVIAMWQAGLRSPIDFVHEDVVSRIWRENPDAMTPAALQHSNDTVLRAFAAELPSTAIVIGL